MPADYRSHKRHVLNGVDPVPGCEWCELRLVDKSQRRRHRGPGPQLAELKEPSLHRQGRDRLARETRDAERSSAAWEARGGAEATIQDIECPYCEVVTPVSPMDGNLEPRCRGCGTLV